MARSNSLSSLPYLGGKSAESMSGLNEWICSNLPEDTRSLYVEPFAGMLGVLLQRSRSNAEIVNDLDYRIVNFWWCLREHKKELISRLAATPLSRTVYEQARTALWSENTLEAAWALSVCLCQGLSKTAETSMGSWQRTLNLSRTDTPMNTYAERLLVVVNRISRVQLECKDAVDLLWDIAEKEYAIVYCDPPYLSASSRNKYAYADTVSFAAYEEALIAQKGRVAISGYADDWDKLSWNRVEKSVSVSANAQGRRAGKPSIRATEVLWTNYDVKTMER